MKFVFIGDGDNDPETLEVYGYEFALGGPAVEVENPAHIAKLSANKNFAQGESAEPAKPIQKRKPGRPAKVKVEQLSDEELGPE